MTEQPTDKVASFFEQPNVRMRHLPIQGNLVPLGIQQVFNPQVGIGGAFGTWGECYDNEALQALIERRLGEPLLPEERMDLSSLGFYYRHHLDRLPFEQHVDLEVEVGSYLLRDAAAACGWQPSEVDAVMIGVSGPVAPDFTERISRAAGIPEGALKVSIHKACDGSASALHLALNPELGFHEGLSRNLADELRGKKVLVGGIEGLSRFIAFSQDKNALQFFGNGAGVVGLIPGESMELLAGKSHEVYDEEGVLAVRMFYPHSGHRHFDHTNIEVSQAGENVIRVAGLMHEPANGKPIAMAGMMGMVKLFVRSGVQVVRDVYGRYSAIMERRGRSNQSIRFAVMHHANLKINQLKAKHLKNEGIPVEAPWVLREFGNVSAASVTMAFLRQLPHMHPGDHVLIDGFGAGTYYDAMIVAVGEG